MKKSIIASVALAALFSIAELRAQGLEDKLRDAQCETSAKAIEAAEKNTVHPKKGTKGATWVKLAEAYMDDATQCGRDSMSSKKAYEIYLKAQEVDAAGDGKSKADIEEALKSVKLHSALLSQGAAYYNAQNLDNALELFKLANTVNPKDTTTTLYAGIVAQQNGNKELAKEYFIKHIDNGGTDAAVFYSLSLIYNEAKEYDTSISLLKKGIAINANDKDLKGQLINTYIVSDKIEDAKRDLKALVDANPTNTANMTNLAIIYDNTGDAENALKYYNQVLAIEPDNYDVNFNLGVMYFNQAVEIKKEVDAMDMKEYQKSGKAVEKKVCDRMAQAQPYFQRAAKSETAEDIVKNNLETIERIIGQCKE